MSDDAVTDPTYPEENRPACSACLIVGLDREAVEEVDGHDLCRAHAHTYRALAARLRPDRRAEGE